MSRFGEYRPVYENSLVDPATFWRTAAAAIDWHRPPQRMFDIDQETHTAQWFPDARLNTCFNALDRHVAAGRATTPALRYESAITDVRRTYSFGELLSEVATFAGALMNLGVERGDRVLIHLPVIPEAVIAMLACARVGAVHTVLRIGAVARELAVRIRDTTPILILTTGNDRSRSSVAQALRSVRGHSVRAVLMKCRAELGDTLPLRPMPPRTRPQWLDWDALVGEASAVAAVPVAARDPLYILYTSGTTGRPKPVVRDNGGHAVALLWTMHNIYDLDAEEVIWSSSDLDWVVGHSCTVYGPLLAGAGTVLRETTSDNACPDTLWRVIAENRVRVLCTTPTTLHSVHPAGPTAERPDISSLSAVFSTGARLDPTIGRELSIWLGKPIIDHWWQTETGWPVCAIPRGLQHLPVKTGSVSVPVPGFRPRVLDEGGNRQPRGSEGNIVLGLPLPPGTLTGLWADTTRFRREYLAAYPGHYLTGDCGYFDEDGYLYLLGRSDNVITVAGHRLSTDALESVLTAHPAVAECVVVGVPDGLKGHRPRGFVVLQSGIEMTGDALRAEIVAQVRRRETRGFGGFTPTAMVAALRTVTVVAALPRTRSGRIMRRTVQQIAAGLPYTVPPDIADPTVLADLSRLISHE